MDLDSPRLALRPIRDDDAPLVHALYQDAQVMRRIGPPLGGPASRDAFIRMRRQADAVPVAARYWTIRRHGDAAGLGLVALIHDREALHSAECGILLQPSAQGRGYASEAIATVARAAFLQCGLVQVWTRQDAGNAAVVALMRRLGFAHRPLAPAGEIRWQLAAGDPAVGAWVADGFANPLADD